MVVLVSLISVGCSLFHIRQAFTCQSTLTAKSVSPLLIHTVTVLQTLTASATIQLIHKIILFYSQWIRGKFCSHTETSLPQMCVITVHSAWGLDVFTGHQTPTCALCVKSANLL